MEHNRSTGGAGARQHPATEPLPIADAIAARDDAHLLRVLLQHEVTFLVVGGMAVRAHGVLKMTQDLDITPARSGSNLKRLADALNALEAQRRRKGATHGEPTVWTAAAFRDTRGIAMVAPKGIIDLAIVPTGTGGYRDLAPQAERRTVAGLEVRVASVVDLRRMKRALGREGDLAVLPELQRLIDEQ